MKIYRWWNIYQNIYYKVSGFDTKLLYFLNTTVCNKIHTAVSKTKFCNIEQKIQIWLPCSFWRPLHRISAQQATTVAVHSRETCLGSSWRPSRRQSGATATSCLATSTSASWRVEFVCCEKKHTMNTTVIHSNDNLSRIFHEYTLQYVLWCTLQATF